VPRERTDRRYQRHPEGRAILLQWGFVRELGFPSFRLRAFTGLLVTAGYLSAGCPIETNVRGTQ
jgi:hypothetical protein